MASAVPDGDRRELSILYGTPRNHHQPYHLLERNGLEPWQDPDSAAEAMAAIRTRPDVRSAAVLLLNMAIADTPYDFLQLRHRHSLIVILPDEANYNQLFGPMRPGCMRTCDGLTSLAENGLRTFRKFADADYYAREMHRQLWHRVWLASFTLRRT